MFNSETVKLGRKPSAPDKRTLCLAHYLDRVELPPAPAAFDWTKAVPKYGMLLNDQVGDCVIAGMMHLAMGFQANSVGAPAWSAAPLVPTDQEVIAAYSAIGGYDPSDSSTDQGCSVLLALKYWRNTGIMIGGKLNKILAFAKVNVANPNELHTGLYLFGGLMTGFDMPLSAQNAKSWTVPARGLVGKGLPGSWGGHCAPLAAEDLSKSGAQFKVITWGETLDASAGFVADYCPEIYAVISTEWIKKNGKAPSGFALDALQADLAAL